jgi:hypothetical protein
MIKEGVPTATTRRFDGRLRGKHVGGKEKEREKEKGREKEKEKEKTDAAAEKARGEEAVDKPAEPLEPPKASAE